MTARFQQLVWTAFFCAAFVAQAQTTFTWTGANGSAFDLGSNWAGGTAPTSSDGAILVFDGNALTRSLALPASIDTASLHFTADQNFYLASLVDDGSTLGLGAGGVIVDPFNEGSPTVTFAYRMPVALLSSQTWDIRGGALVVSGPIGERSLSAALTKTGSGSLSLFGDSTFSGGLTVAEGRLLIGNNSTGDSAVTSGPVGSGPLTLADETGLAALQSDVTLGNDLSLGNRVTFGSADHNYSLTLTGNLTPAQTDTEIFVEGSAPLFLAGSLLDARNAESSIPSSYTFGKGTTVLSGANTYTGTTTVNGAAAVFLTCPSISSGSFSILNGGYLGVGTSGDGEKIIRQLDSPASVSGSLGLDTLPSAPAPTEFGDTLDFSGFDPASFSGLSSLSRAIFAGTVTPVGAGNYKFGGYGSGTLYVTADLPEVADRTTALAVDSLPGSWLTAVLRGNNSFGGDILVQNGIVVLDSEQALPAGSRVELSGNTPYIGYTERFAGVDSFNQFVTERVRLAESDAAYDPIIGFDSHNFISAQLGLEVPTVLERTVADDIDLRLLGRRVYLGTATRATLTGTIHDGDLYAAGIGSGWLKIASPLTRENNIGLVVVGSGNAFSDQHTDTGAIEFDSAQSDFAGPTTLYTGSLVVGASSTTDSHGAIVAGPLGTGLLQVLGEAATLAAGAADVTLHNPISLQNHPLQVGIAPTLDATARDALLQSLVANNLTLAGSITGPSEGTDQSTLDVYGRGTLALTAANSFSFLNVNASSVVAANDRALAGTKIALFDGGQVTFTTGAPAIGSISDGWDGGSALHLAAGSTLTIAGAQGGYFGGAIDDNLQGAKVAFASTGSLSLSGASSYTGGTIISSGTLYADNNRALGSGPVSIGGGRLYVNSGITLANSISFSGHDGFGGFLEGTGALAGSVTVAHDGVVNPAYDGGPGQLSFANGLTFGAGGFYHLDLGSPEHQTTPGTDYDTLAITGSLNLSASLAHPFHLVLGDDVNNFGGDTARQWQIASATGGVPGFDAGRIHVDDGYADAGGFTLRTSADHHLLFLAFTPASVWHATSDHLFSTAANWQSGAVPVSDGTAWIRFDAPDSRDSSTEIALPANFSAGKLVFGATDQSNLSFELKGPGTLTLDQGIFSPTYDGDYGGAHITFGPDVNIVLANSQLAEFSSSSSLDIQGDISESGGSRGFGISGLDFNVSTLRLAGHNTFSGGVYVGKNSRVVVASDAALGSGDLTLALSAAVVADGARVLPNPVVFDGAVAFFETWNGSSSDSLTFSGLFTLTQSLTLTSYLDTDVRLAGGIVESTADPASLAYSNYSGGKLIITGGATYTGGTRVTQGALIFGDAASVPAVGSLVADRGAYLGLADPAGVANLLSHIDPVNFSGALGFDSLGHSSNTFVNVDLSGLTNLGAIGTQTFATLSGTLTPSGLTYAFGGGAGTLTVSSVLEDDPYGGTSGDHHAFSLLSPSAHAFTSSAGSRDLTLSDGMKLNLYGDNTYSGGTTVNSGYLYAGSNTALGSGAVAVVDGKLEVPAGITLANDIDLAGVLLGSGTLAGSLNFQPGGTLSPGGSGIGRLTFSGPVTWGAGAGYEVNFGPGTGNLVAGTDYDTIVSTNASFTLDATRSSPFAITFDTPADFSPTQAYAWKIAATASGITHFDTGHFSLSNPGITLHEGFTLSLTGSDLYLRYTPQTLWTGSGDGTHYTTAGNWSGYTAEGVPPVDGTARLYFGNVGHSSVVLPANLDVSSFEFGGSSGALAYSFSGPGTIVVRNGMQSSTDTDQYAGVTFGADLNLLLANSQTFGGYALYRFLGPIGETDANRSLTLGYGTTAYLSGANSYTGGTYAEVGAQLFFTNDAAIPAAGTIASNYGSYVGIPSAGALARIDPGQFHGTLGLESFGSGTSEYANLDLTHFANLGVIGSTTSALISGTFTPPADTSTYFFGGGGGKITVSANLTDAGSTRRHLYQGGPGTLVLTGNNTLSGNIFLFGGTTLIAGPGALPASLSSLYVSAGSYLGYTEAYSPASPESFFARPTGISPDGMLGIDSSDLNAPRTILGSIDLSNHGARTNAFFLGTATKVILSSGTLTAPLDDKILYFGATSSGYLVVNNTLSAGTVNSLVVGSADWTGTVELGGNNTFTGGTAVNGGKLVVAANSALGAASSPVTVGERGRLSIASGVTLSNPIAFSGGQKAFLAGNGTFGAPIILSDGAGMAPGNSVGHLNFAAGLTWSGGGGYEVEVQDVDGAAGVGYDSASVTGTLEFNATVGSPFTIYLKSLTGSGAAGNVANFVASAAYSWIIADATALSGFGALAAQTVAVDATGFTNAFAGTFGLTTSGNSVLLTYTPAAVPEPSTWALLLGGLLAVAFWSRRKQTS